MPVSSLIIFTVNFLSSLPRFRSYIYASSLKKKTGTDRKREEEEISPSLPCEKKSASSRFQFIFTCARNAYEDSVDVLALVLSGRRPIL